MHSFLHLIRIFNRILFFFKSVSFYRRTLHVLYYNYARAFFFSPFSLSHSLLELLTRTRTRVSSFWTTFFLLEDILLEIYLNIEYPRPRRVRAFAGELVYCCRGIASWPISLLIWYRSIGSRLVAGAFVWGDAGTGFTNFWFLLSSQRKYAYG